MMKIHKLTELHYRLGWNGKYLALGHFAPFRYHSGNNNVYMYIHVSNDDLTDLTVSIKFYLYGTSWIIHLLSNHVLQLPCKIMHQVVKLLAHFVRILDKIHSIDHRTRLGWCKL